MTDTAKPRAYADPGSFPYALMLAALCVVVVLSGIGATKGVMFGPVITDGGFFLFPLAYILGDVITEVYGPRAARRTIITGFAVNIVAALTFTLLIALPGMGDEYGAAKQQAMELTLGQVWRVVLAGMLGFAVGQTANSLTMWWGKRRSGEKGMWGRLASATGLGELLDTVVFCTVAAGAIGITSVEDWANYTFFGFVYKVAVQYAVMPLTGWAIGWLKRNEPTYQESLRQLESAVPTHS